MRIFRSLFGSVSLSLAALLMVLLGLALSCKSSRRVTDGGSAPFIPRALPPRLIEANKWGYSFPAAAKDRKSAHVAQLNRNCVACHIDSDSATMHKTRS